MKLALLSTYHFTTGTIIEAFTALAALLTIGILWRSRKSKEVKYLIYLEVFIAIWATTYALEFGTSNLEIKVFWSKMSYLGIAFAPLSYFLFTTAFSQKEHIINLRNITLLSVIPFVTLLMVFTNDYHHLVWPNVTLDPVVNIAHYDHGIWFWVFFGYSQLLIFSGLFNLISSIYKFTAFYRTQVSTLVIASFIPIIANLVYVTKINPFPGFDWTPVSFVFTGIIVSFGIIRYRMFDLVPNARNKLIDTMEDGVIVINAEGFTEDCNNTFCQIFRKNKKDVLYRSYQSVFSDFAELDKAIVNKSKISTELKLLENNVPLFYHVRVIPIFNHQGRFSGNFLQFHDITSMKQAESKLKQINSQLKREITKREQLIESLDSFGHTLAHDLKNLLGSIYSSGEVLEETIRTDDKEISLEMVDTIKDSAEKTIRITQELLILATVSHQEVEKKPLDMNKIFSEAKNQLKELIEQQKPAISEPQKWPVAIGHAAWIEDVWVNYLSNAIKYGGSPSEITVGADETDDGEVKFWIKDNGNGIPEPEQSKLFQKHTRLNPKKAQGYGLGLSIVKRIIDKLDGTVGVESTGKENEGALFYFILPA